MLPQLIAAAAILAAQAQPPAAAPACVTRQQVADLTLVVLPDAVTTVSQQCAATLPANAFLRAGASAWMERLRAEGAGRRASALAAFTTLTASRLPPGISPELAMSGMSSMMLTQMLSGRMNAAVCAETSVFLQALSALPPANFRRHWSMAGWASRWPCGRRARLSRPAPAARRRPPRRRGRSDRSAPRERQPRHHPA